MNTQELIEETRRRFNFISNYNPAQPENYRKTLREIKGDDKTLFNHDFLVKMREGKVKSNHPIFEILHHVNDILLTEAYNTFSEFMQSLRTDEQSLKNPKNAIRMVYNGFKSGNPQQWKLINPDEYKRCMTGYANRHSPLSGESGGGMTYTGKEASSHFGPQSGAFDDYWCPRIWDWVASAKDNVAQLAANSYLNSGPSLDPRVTNSKGELTHSRLWYDLSGDPKIPLTKEDNSTIVVNNEGQEVTKQKYFDRTYWIPFVKYIGTDFGDSEDGEGVFETDSALDGFFNAVAQCDKHHNDCRKLFGALDFLIHVAHNRGSFAHLFMKGGNKACAWISNN